MKLIDSNKFFLQGTDNRFLHLATVHYGTREFICFKDTLVHNIYIEEITGGSLVFIEDDNLAFDLAKFLELKGVTDIKKSFALPIHGTDNR